MYIVDVWMHVYEYITCVCARVWKKGTIKN